MTAENVIFDMFKPFLATAVEVKIRGKGKTLPDGTFIGGMGNDEFAFAIPQEKISEIARIAKMMWDEDDVDYPEQKYFQWQDEDTRFFGLAVRKLFLSEGISVVPSTLKWDEERHDIYGMENPGIPVISFHPTTTEGERLHKIAVERGPRKNMEVTAEDMEAMSKASAERDLGEATTRRIISDLAERETQKSGGRGGG